VQEERRDGEILYQRCAGLDVHKKNVKTCLKTSSSDGRPGKEVRTYATNTKWHSNLLLWLVKPDVRLSPHPAFRTRPCDQCSTPERPLMSAAQPVAESPPLCRRTRLSYSWCFPLSRSSLIGDFPGGPSSCPAHDRLAFGYYAASALCPASWHFRVPCG
jgi:hypothetical protein